MFLWPTSRCWKRKSCLSPRTSSAPCWSWRSSEAQLSAISNGDDNQRRVISQLRIAKILYLSQQTVFQLSRGTLQLTGCCINQSLLAELEPRRDVCACMAHRGGIVEPGRTLSL